ncbi:hypothetical protein [Streptomyces sp. NPDC059916]|uniref:hypothetical protein n=1 Tax=Streptomyces sp. NPDC059916 TaxID=3347001 RepID=UPI0036C75F10
MHSALLLEPLQDASPTEELRHNFHRGEMETSKTRFAAAMEAAGSYGPILRVVPHLNNDACGFSAPHGAYSLNYAVPMLCPGLHDNGLTEAEVWRSCLTCWGFLTQGTEIESTSLHVALWDVSEPTTFRLDEHARDQWDDLVYRIYEWDTDSKNDGLSPEHRLASQGVWRRMQLDVLSRIDATAAEYMSLAHKNGVPVGRLAALSGISRRTVPSWLQGHAAS